MNKSEQTKQGLKRSFESGISKKASIVCYGYRKDKRGALIINEQEAEAVRKIYAAYLEGKSLGKIADMLFAQNISSPSGKEKWNRETIDKVLSNEKYIGCVMLGKSRYENGKQVRTDMADRVTYMNSHPFIISWEVFEAVQMEKKKRSKTVNVGSKKNVRKIVEKSR